jgi:hypothetical protein
MASTNNNQGFITTTSDLAASLITFGFQDAVMDIH